MITFLLIFLTSCNGQKQSLSPTFAPIATPSIAPTHTPTITPTPTPQVMKISDLLEDCEGLADRQSTVILTGKVFLPDETVYGYQGWYGMDLIQGDKVRALFSVGTGVNQMEDLPQYFHEQDLLIYAADGRLIRHAHEVSVTGRAKYRADSEDRRCEIYVESVESRMPATVLEPMDLKIGELLDGNEVNDCDDLEFSRQFIRLTGAVRLDDYSSMCQLGVCKIIFTDSTGNAFVYLLEGEGSNRMQTLPEQFSDRDLVIRDRDGVLVENKWLSLVGVTRQGDVGACELIVYAVEAGE